MRAGCDSACDQTAKMRSHAGAAHRKRESPQEIPGNVGFPLVAEAD